MSKSSSDIGWVGKDDPEITSLSKEDQLQHNSKTYLSLQPFQISRSEHFNGEL